MHRKMRWMLSFVLTLATGCVSSQQHSGGRSLLQRNQHRKLSGHSSHKPPNHPEKHAIAEPHKPTSQQHGLTGIIDGGRLTFYATGLGACGKYSKPSEYVVALNDIQWDGGKHCFEMITIQHNGKQTRAQIVDRCPTCPYGALDCSPGLFKFFATEAVGVIHGDWFFGRAPASHAVADVASLPGTPQPLRILETLQEPSVQVIPLPVSLEQPLSTSASQSRPDRTETESSPRISQVTPLLDLLPADATVAQNSPEAEEIATPAVLATANEAIINLSVLIGRLGQLRPFQP